MTQQHTQGRLRAGSNGGFGQGPMNALYIAESDVCGDLIAILVTTPPNPNVEADARRLVACWNACEMVSTEDLEALTRPGDVSWACTIDRVVRERNELRKTLLRIEVKVEALIAQRDELLEALRGVEKRCAAQGFVGMDGQYLKEVRAAIAKAEGGAAPPAQPDVPPRLTAKQIDEIAADNSLDTIDGISRAIETAVRKQFGVNDE